VVLTAAKLKMDITVPTRNSLLIGILSCKSILPMETITGVCSSSFLNGRVFTRSFIVLAFCLLQVTSQVPAQTNVVENLLTTGYNLDWYADSSGGTELDQVDPAIVAQYDLAGQMVNGDESKERFSKGSTVNAQSAPEPAFNSASQVQITWNWNPAAGATGYKWGTSNVYTGATDVGSAESKTEIGLTCGTVYRRYVWAYNENGVISASTMLAQATYSCATLATIVTTAPTGIGTASAIFNGNIGATGGSFSMVRGFKFAVTDGFDPETSGIILSDTGSFGIGAFSLAASGLDPGTTYYVRAFATNGSGTSYGCQASFKTVE
jgi:hypothetical protein